MFGGGGESALCIAGIGGLVGCACHVDGPAVPGKRPRSFTLAPLCARQERIFVSSKAKYAPGTAIRGGVPICWPQFGKKGPLAQQHGFARNSTWTLAHSSESTAVYRLSQADARLPEGWTQPFELEMEARLGRACGGVRGVCAVWGGAPQAHPLGLGDPRPQALPPPHTPPPAA